ncbi:hypothetical protein [Microvirga solisilvae]|uniref:hypothetical protein n=1 Tax=Microvirga solisilvae TaxID=2919498 RepID=UPI001FAFA737|nr:hypothetical protein [Microvirga solisilvae]
MTEDALRSLLPEGQVKRVFRPMGEGVSHCGTEIYSGTEDVAFVLWGSMQEEYYYNSQEEDEANEKKCLEATFLSQPIMVAIDANPLEDRPQSAWHTTRGIQIGNSIRKLERIGGKPFEFSICECDVGGNTMLDDIPEFANLVIRLSFPGVNTDHLSGSFPRETSDTPILSSSVPNSMAHQFIVTSIRVYISGEASENSAPETDP